MWGFFFVYVVILHYTTVHVGPFLCPAGKIFSVKEAWWKLFQQQHM